MSIADKLIIIAENEPKVYDSGYADGTGSFDSYWKREIEQVTIPDGVTALNNWALRYQSKLKSVNLPSGLLTIGEYCFANCTDLIRIVLPNTVTELGRGAFSVSGLAYLDKIPASVKTIGNMVFNHCNTLKIITFEGTPTSIAPDAFNGCWALKTINVPWSQGAITGAPWGATNANIVYNYNDAQTVFYLEDTEWVFEAGMTWAEFIDSDYNTDNAFFHADVSIDADGNTIAGVGYGPQYVYDDNNNPVNSSSKISVGGSYYRA